MDSPRGRIYLIRAAAEGRGSISQSFVQHMNLCLMCRACETACPSGVKFGFLMEAARGQVDRPGVYNLLHPELAQQFLDRKIERIKETGAEVVVSGNPGCSLQIEKGLYYSLADPQLHLNLWIVEHQTLARRSC